MMNFATTSKQIEDAYALARERYSAIGVDTEQALETLRRVPISLQCWQGDDVLGFEEPDRGLGGGLMATGNYPGRARTVDELRSDLDVAYSVIPGSHRLNLHAMYPDSDESPPRNEIAPRHFQGWAQWAGENGRGIDFNPTLFSHPLADDGFTLASYDNDIRQFWIQHCIACREIGAFFGQELGTPAMTNIWIPDGLKDSPSDRTTPRQLLNDALDQIFEKEIDPNHNRDAVECKLFGLGSESYVVGSHEFYLGYAARNDKALCLDAGHFHPTEVISDKISACLLFVPELVLHVSRGVRWDSDHVVTFSDELQAIMQEIVRGCHLDRVHIGLDYFDASINRVAAWAIGTRNSLRALLLALLEPRDALQEIERKADYTTRLALMEELKVMPHAAVWDYHCLQQDVPIGMAFLEDIRSYEKDVLSHRG